MGKVSTVNRKFKKVKVTESKTAQHYHIMYFEGYCKALRDIYSWFLRAQQNYKSDRRNNIKHVLWTLEGILEEPSALMEYGDMLPISMEAAGKKTRYYVDMDDRGKGR